MYIDVSLNPTPMTCRSDYSALDTITMILQVFHTDSPTIHNYKWALEMIQHEVELTDRVCVPASEVATAA